MTIVNDDSRVVNELEASLTDDARVVIYDHHMFIVQATDVIFTPQTLVCFFFGATTIQLMTFALKL
jgi:hypothetical protein